MKKMIKKVIAPVLVITVLFAVLRPFCIQDGECNYFLLLLLMGIPFGIGKMCVWMVPRGFDLRCPYSRCQFTGCGSCPSDRWQYGQ